MAMLGVHWYYGLGNVLHWDTLSELDEIPTIADSFSDGQLKYTINGNAYLVKERFLASTMQVNTVATYLFLGCFVIGLNMLVAAFSSVSRYWFLGGMIILAGVLVTLRFENIFNTTNQAAFLIAFAAFAGLAFYFNNFATKASFLKKFLSFSGITLLTAGIIAYYAKSSHPFLSIAAYGSLGAIVLTVLFILLVAHENVASLVWVVSNSGIKGKSSLGQFLIISSIYLLNVLLIFLKQNLYIDWSILAISPILFYLVSTILGIWGFRNASEESANFQFRTIGSWVYLGLAIIATATLGQAYATGNDPLTDAFENFIVIAHLVVGFAFFLYVILNYIQALQKGLPIHRILYKPQFIELSLFRLGAVVGIVTVLSLKHFYAYYEVSAGYYNNIADYYKSVNDLPYAEAFYKEATHSDVRNHKSNYSLATLAMEMNDKENTGLFLKNALEKNPSPYAYAGLSKIFQEKDMFFDALFTLQAGVKKFPENQQILTNLAWLYEKTKVIDSTRHYLQLAQKHCTNCELAEANLLAFRLKYNRQDTLSNVKDKSTYVGLLANQTAVLNATHKPEKAEIRLNADSALNVSQFAVLYNLSTFNNPLFTYSSNTLRRLQLKAVNQGFFEDLEYAIACQNYYREDKLEGLKQLAILANDSTRKKQLYNQVAGMWYLQQGVYEKALVHLGKAGDKSSVEVLQKQDYQSTIREYQEVQAEELLKNASNKKDFDNALKISPLNPYLLKKVVDFYNQQLKQPNQAYTLLFNALQLNENSIELWKLYAIQSLKIGLENYADDGLKKLQVLSTPTDYQAFLSIYQAQKALMEKNKAGFE
ncbi:tetratricopeptide repeat protein [Emticicia sp. 17c]|uniref:tetratricopeptide repeat protein n=1 Tax=Emticicia sp. 17c TaxID=3127704 RepID=UPI00301D7C85